MEHKSMSMETKSIDDRTVTTLFSTAGVVDYVDDRMHSGAFSKTIQERGSKVLHLWAHDGLPPIAVVDSLREVARTDLPKSIQSEYPDAVGGCMAVSTYIDSPRGNEVLSAIKAGAPLEASFGYDVLQSSFTTEGQRKIRNIKEVRLYEISTCQFGANPATRGDASKSLAIPSASKIRRTLQSLKSMDGYDIWSEAYDIYGAASALSSVAMLMDGEQDDPQQMAQLLGACRLLLAFIAGEIDSIESGALVGGMELASRVFASAELQIKVAMRNAAKDQAAIDSIHQLAYDLGATNCLGIPDSSGDKSRADEPTGASLTLLRSKLAYLDFAIKE